MRGLWFHGVAARHGVATALLHRAEQALRPFQQYLIDCQAAPCGRAPAPSLRAMAGTPPSTRPAPALLARAVRWTWTVDPPRVPASAREDALVSAWKALDDDAARRLGEARASLATTATQAGSLGERFAALAGAQPFEFRPRPRPSPGQPGRSSNRYVPPAEPATIEAVPAEPLPAVGSLWIDRSTRYLVIERWDDLEQGEEEARRLRAQLVAPKEQS